MLKDSDLQKWTYREHTRMKHIIMEKYLKAWITILGSFNERICYFDGFAGRGEYTGGSPGSPLIALRVADELQSYYKKFICVFIEKDSENFNNLESILEREVPKIKHMKKIEIIKQNDEFANVTEEIFKNLEQQKYVMVPSFFFIDPFGFSGVPFEIVKKILSNPRTEVFFTFMVRDVNRFLSHEKLEETFNELFGNSIWKEGLKTTDNQELALRDLYRQNLHRIAGLKYSWSFRVCTPEKLQTLYYLIHGTNNFKGHSIMKQVMYNQSAEGDFAYLGPEDMSRRSQIKLFDVEDIEALKKYLSVRFKSNVKTYDEIQIEVCEPWYDEPPYIDKHYRQALKGLEKEQKVKIERISSKKSGLKENDKITFL